MGIYDREYYRREGPSFLDSFTNRGKVCKWLIIINISAFVLQLLTRQKEIGLGGWWWKSAFTDAFILNVDAVLHGQVWRLLTYAFLHDPNSIWHIVFNMLFLWWFGSDVEDLYGPREFLAFYLVSAVLGGIAFVLLKMAEFPRPECLGASGAVTAVLVLCAIHYPTRIIYLFMILPVPLWLFVIFEVLMDLNGLFGMLGSVNTRTAVSVHLAGAGFALLYHMRQWRLMPIWDNLRSLFRGRSRPKLRVYPEDEPQQPVAVPTSAAAQDVDEQLEAKLDAVLEKVSRLGKDSLTPSEQEVLLRASEVYKRRRT